MHVEGGVEGFALAGGCAGEQAGGVGKFVDQGRVAGRGWAGVFEGVEFGLDGGLLVVEDVELVAEPVA